MQAVQLRLDQCYGRPGSNKFRNYVALDHRLAQIPHTDREHFLNLINNMAKCSAVLPWTEEFATKFFSSNKFRCTAEFLGLRKHAEECVDILAYAAEDIASRLHSYQARHPNTMSHFQKEKLDFMIRNAHLKMGLYSSSTAIHKDGPSLFTTYLGERISLKMAEDEKLDENAPAARAQIINETIADLVMKFGLSGFHNAALQMNEYDEMSSQFLKQWDAAKQSYRFIREQ